MEFLQRAHLQTNWESQFGQSGHGEQSMAFHALKQGGRFITERHLSTNGFQKEKPNTLMQLR